MSELTDYGERHIDIDLSKYDIIKTKKSFYRKRKVNDIELVDFLQYRKNMVNFVRYRTSAEKGSEILCFAVISPNELAKDGDFHKELQSYCALPSDGTIPGNYSLHIDDQTKNKIISEIVDIDVDIVPKD